MLYTVSSLREAHVRSALRSVKAGCAPITATARIVQLCAAVTSAGHPPKTTHWGGGREESGGGGGKVRTQSEHDCKLCMHRPRAHNAAQQSVSTRSHAPGLGGAPGAWMQPGSAARSSPCRHQLRVFHVSGCGCGACIVNREWGQGGGEGDTARNGYAALTRGRATRRSLSARPGCEALAHSKGRTCSTHPSRAP